MTVPESEKNMADLRIFFSLPSVVKVARKARAPGHGVAVGAVPHPRPEDEGEPTRVWWTGDEEELYI